MQKISNNANDIKAKMKRNKYCAILCVLVAFIMFLAVGPNKLLAYFTSVQSTTNSFTIRPPYELTYTFYEVDGNGQKTQLERTDVENLFAGEHVILGQDASHTIVNSNYVSREFVIDGVVRQAGYDFVMPYSDKTIEQDYYLACYSVSTTNGIQKFRTLQEAFDNADLTGSTITVLRDVTETTTPVLSTAQENKNVTLDLQGKTLTLDNCSITNNGTLTITDSNTAGQITSTTTAINNNGTLTLGINDSTTDTTAPEIIGETNGIVNASGSTFNFYDGVVMGQTSSVNTQNVTVNTPTGYRIVNTTDTVDGDTYNVATLSNLYTVTYDCGTNGGQVSIDDASTTFTEQVAYNTAVDLTKYAYKQYYQIAGWNTNSAATTGLSSLTMPANDIIVYAIYEALAPDAVIITAKVNDATGADYIPGDWTNQNIYIELSESDPQQQVLRYEIYQNGAWTSTGITTTNNVGTLTISSDMDETVRFRAIGPGNQPSQESTISIKRDTVKPTITYADVFTNGTNLINVTVTLADQGGSGLTSNVAHVYKSNDPTTFSGAATNITSGSSHTFTATQDDNTYIFVEYVTDNAGNTCEDDTNTVTINGTKYYRFGPYDRIKPVIQITTTDYNTFTWTATDDSTISSYGVIEHSTSTVSEPSTWTTITGNATGTYDIDTTQQQYYHVWVQDEYGNKNHIYTRPVRLQKSVAANTTLELRNTDSTGEVIDPAYVLPGCDIYVTGTLATGYHDLVITADGVDYQPGSIVTIGNSETAISTSATLNTYNVVYDLAGGQLGSGDSFVTTVTYNNRFAVPNPASRPGYTFLGWTSSSQDGLGPNAMVAPLGGSYLSAFVPWDGTATTYKGYYNLTDVNNGTVTLTALWQANAAAPVITAKLNDSTGANYSAGTWTNQNVYIELSQSDVNNQIDHYEWYVNGAWVSTGITTTNNVGTLTISQNMDETIRFRAVSVTGYVSPESTISVKRDDINPTIVYTATQSADYSKVSMSITCADTGGSGLFTGYEQGRTQFNVWKSTSANSLSSNNYTNYSSNNDGTSFDINLATTGDYYIFIQRIRDNAYNYSVSNADLITIDGKDYYRVGPFRYDITAPVVTISTVDYNTFSWSATDLSNIVEYNVTQTTGSNAQQPSTWIPLNGATSGTYDIDTTSLYYYTVWVKDEYGNVGKKVINPHRLYKDQGSNTTLVIKENDANGYEFTNTYTYILAGTQLYITADLVPSTGYDIELGKGSTVLAQGGSSVTATVVHNESSRIYSKANEYTYTIAYDYDGGQAGSGTVVTSARYTQKFAVNTPTKTGYSFDGWTSSVQDGLGPNAKSATTTGGTFSSWDGTKTTNKGYTNLTDVNGGTVTLTAHWFENNYEVLSSASHIAYYATLEDAIAGAQSGYYVKALKDQTDTSSPVVPSGKNIKFDLAGYEVTLNETITNNGTLDIYSTVDGGVLYSSADVVVDNNGGTFSTNYTSSANTVSIISTSTEYKSYISRNLNGGTERLCANSTLTFANAPSTGEQGNRHIIGNYGTVVVNGATLINNAGNTSAEQGITNASTAPDSKITINSGTITTSGVSLWNNGSTKGSEADAAIRVNGGTITSSQTNAIRGDKAGGLIHIVDGTITANNHHAVNVGAGSSAIIRGGTIESENGIGVYSRSETEGGVTTYGAITLGQSELNANVSTTSPSITGTTYGVYSETGATFNFYDGVIVGQNGAGSAYSREPVTQTGYGVQKTVTTENGVTTETAILVQKNYELLNGNTHLNYYATLEDALADAASGNTVRVLQNVTDASSPELAANKNVQLDLNGYVITLSNTIVNYGNLDVYSSRAIQNGSKIMSSAESVIDNEGGTFTTNYTSNTVAISIINTSTEYQSYVTRNRNGGTEKFYTNSTLTFANAPSTGTQGNRHVVGNLGTVELNGATIINNAGGTNAEQGITNASTAPNSKIIVNSGTITTSGISIWNNGSTKMTLQDPAVLINGGTITSSQTNAVRTEDIRGIAIITGGTITSTNFNAINVGAGSAAIITGGTIESQNGIGVYSRSADVQGITQYGDITIGTNESPVSVSTTVPNITGTTYGVYVESGAKFSFYDGVIVGQNDAGSSISRQPSTPDGYVVQKTVATSGNTTTETAILIPEVYAEYNGNTKVAGYATLEEAFSNATSGNTIKVMANNYTDASTGLINCGSDQDTNKSLILDLNGKTLTIEKKLVNYGTLDIYNSQSTDAVLYTSVAEPILNNGTFTTNGTSTTNKMSIINTSTADYVEVIRTDNNATFNANSTLLVQNAPANSASTSSRYVVINRGTATVNGATLQNTAGTAAKKFGISNASSSSTARIIVNDGSTIISNANAIINNASTQTGNTPAILVNGGTIESEYNAAIANYNGEAKILGGTIESLADSGVVVYGSSTVTIGQNDSTVTSSATAKPSIEGATYGVEISTGTVNFYDGVIIGPASSSISGTVAGVPTGYSVFKYPDNGQEIAILAGEAKFADGKTVNKAMKSLAAGTQITDHKTLDSSITAIAKYNGTSMPSNVTAVRVEAEDSEAPIFMWYDNGTIYWYCGDSTPSLNEDASFMFSRMQVLTDISGVSTFDASNTTNLRATFHKQDGATVSPTNLNALASWDVGNVEDFSGMFEQNVQLTNLNALQNWNTGSATAMLQMFNRCDALSDISGVALWDVRNVEDLGGIFNKCSSLTNISVLSNWKTESNKSLRISFQDVPLTTLEPLRNWDVSNVVDMQSAFGGNSTKTVTSLEPLSNWNVGNVEAFNLMFCRFESLTNLHGLENWNMESATDIGLMFKQCTGLTDATAIKDWDVDSVTNTAEMFSGCTSLQVVDLSNWKTPSLEDTHLMFYNDPSLTTIYASTDFVTTNVTESTNMFGGCNVLDGGNGTRYLNANPKDKTYAHLDGGSQYPGYFRVNTNIYKYSEVQSNGTIINLYPTLQEAFDSATSGNTIKALVSHTDASTSAPTVVDGKTLKLDMAGNEVTLTYRIENYGTLDIYSSANGGKLNRNGVVLNNRTGGTLTTNGTSSSGTLAIVNTTTDGSAASTVIQSYGSLALNTNTTVTYENPATSGTANWYAVYVVDGTTTVNGATISNMLGGTSNELGIIIKTNAPNAKIIVNSGTVEASSIAVWNGGSTQNTTANPAIKIAGGTVRSTGNNAIKNSVENSLVYITGGTVYSTGANTIMSDGNVTMTGGTVYAYSGMGISVHGSSTLAISGGLVSKEINPETNAWVGGACVQINGAANGILSGNAVIQNKAGNGSNVIYNISTGTLTIDGATVQNLGTSVAGTNASSGTIYVKSGIVSSAGQAVLNNASNSGPIIIGESGSTSTSSPVVTGQVTGTTNAGQITINGGKISSTTNMTVRSYGNITINGGLIENNTADTGSNWPYTVFIDSNDSLITVNGGTITNNTHAAVVVKNGTTGDITINGGTITTTASTAVLDNEGDIIITGGTITATGGNGVTCSDGTVTVGDSASPVTSIDNNTATEPRITGSAYGVQVGSNGTFSFYDGVIKGASGQSISRNPDNTPINYTVRKTTANSVETAILTNTYSITLNPNGGSYNGLTSNSIVSANYGEEVNIGYPTRTGYTFTGWKTSGDEITDINILKNTTAMTEFVSSSLSTNALGGWRIASNTGGSRTIINVTDPPEPGITKGFDIPGAGNAQDVAQDKIYVTSGNQYTMSVWAKGTGTLRLQLAAQSPFTYKSFTLNNVTEWTKYTWTVTAGSSSGEATIANGYVNAYFGNSGASGTDIQICGMKLEEGTGFSDLLWSKVPSTITSPTLIAQWEVNKYKVTLDSQSANTAGTTQAWYYYNTTAQVGGVTAYYYSDEACTTPLSGGYSITLPTKTGYTFGGYYTETNGGGTQYVNSYGSFINNLYKTDGNRTLYAKWTPNKYKITLNNQSATTAGTTAAWYYYDTTAQVGGVTAYYYSNEACTTPLSGGYNITKPTKTGYEFGGYYTETNGGGTQYVSASGSFINNAYKTMGNKTLYAKWTEIPTFDTGTNVNLKMKILAGQHAPTTTTANTNITSIQKVSTIPSQYKTSNNLVSISSSAPIYMWFDNGTIKWWCETDTVYLNSDSSWMFAWLEGTTSIDTAKFDTSKVVNMSRLFSDCACSSINVTNFDTSNVTDMSVMFCASANLTSLDLRNFNTSNVTTMDGMFWQCSGLTNLNLTSFNTINVTNMEGMFYDCRSLRYLNLESFNTRNVTDMLWMFSACSSLENIYVTTSFVTTSVGNGEAMFRGCTSLVGGSGTTYSTQHEDYDYARIDDPNNGKPGYFCRVVI